ncbi:hypothetical protein [Roseiterribacter gracilis]|uniref:COG3904 family protein n=1 Tax=Roseiterribacter gracilis TaxID=2812848 RepID=UPI003B439922
MTSAAGNQPRKRFGWLGRHWRGELPLAQSYWVGFWLVGVAINVALYVAGGDLESHTTSYNMWFALGAVLVGALIGIWQIVGVWRAAAHASRRVWRGLVRLHMALVASALVLAVLFVGVMIDQIAPLLAGIDPLGSASIETLRGGRVVSLRGPIGSGDAQRFAAVMQRSPNAKLLLLDSPGGRINEAFQMADVVAARGVTTAIVQGRCASACTLLFANGKDRLSSKAVFGFHRPGGLPGSQVLLRVSKLDEVFRTKLVRAGIDGAFADRGLAVPTSSLWTPTIEELTAAHVVTGPAVAPLGVALAQPPQAQLERDFASSQLLEAMRTSKRSNAIWLTAASVAATYGLAGASAADLEAATRPEWGHAASLAMTGADAAQLDRLMQHSLEIMRAQQATAPQLCHARLMRFPVEDTSLSPAQQAREREIALAALTAEPLPASQRVVIETVAGLKTEVLARARAKAKVSEADVASFTTRRGRDDAHCRYKIALGEELAALPDAQRTRLLRVLNGTGVFARPDLTITTGGT